MIPVRVYVENYRGSKQMTISYIVIELAVLLRLL